MYSQGVNKATPVITWANPSPIAYGTMLSSTQLDATVNTGGMLLYTPNTGTVLGLGTGQSLHVDFTPSDSTDYFGTSANVSIDVVMAAPTFNFDLSTLTAETFGNAAFSVASSGHNQQSRANHVRFGGRERGMLRYLGWPSDNQRRGSGWQLLHHRSVSGGRPTTGGAGLAIVPDRAGSSP